MVFCGGGDGTHTRLHVTRCDAVVLQQLHGTFHSGMESPALQWNSYQLKPQAEQPGSHASSSTSVCALSSARAQQRLDSRKRSAMECISSITRSTTVGVDQKQLSYTASLIDYNKSDKGVHSEAGGSIPVVHLVLLAGAETVMASVQMRVSGAGPLAQTAHRLEGVAVAHKRPACVP